MRSGAVDLELAPQQRSMVPGLGARVIGQRDCPAPPIAAEAVPPRLRGVLQPDQPSADRTRTR